MIFLENFGVVLDTVVLLLWFSRGASRLGFRSQKPMQDAAWDLAHGFMRIPI